VLTAALVLGALLAVAAVLFVARPLLREPRGDDSLQTPAPEERRRLELAEERDRALAALKELEFDHRTGKISDEDYRSLVGELRRDAADALRALDVGNTAE
jgi:cytochrome c-type biogenesis protein CcmI